jgi:squalene-hopene/tetraprenyl-beta-curcumene cyclase
MMMTKSKLTTLAFAVAFSISACAFAQRVLDGQHGAIADPGQLPHAKLPDNLNDRVQYLIDRGLNFLKSQQKDDGGWQRETDPPGITAIVLRAFVQDEKFPAKTPFVKKGYDKLFSYQQLDSGGIYQDLLANYNTAIAVSAIAAANEPAYKERLDRAVAFLKKLQWTEDTKGPKGETVTDKSNTWYGGWGYGNHARPDLSNAQTSIQALHDAGLKPDDKAYQAALVFLSRTQNNSETNDQPWTGDDGGFIYTPANNGGSEAGETTIDGRRVVRSYGSMTYAGLKSMIYAGLSKDDPRVKAAVDWITKHWTLEENPAMRDAGDQFALHGLYYYYYTFAHALDAYDEPVITDAKGAKHDWRRELIDKVASLQNEDGSFVGEKRWMESNPVLTTAYVVLALQEAQRDLKQHPPH